MFFVDRIQCKMFLLKIFNEILCSQDQLHSVIHSGLGLSTTFDIFDHQFLFEILAKSIGLQTVVLLFIKNYHLHCSQQIIINGCHSGDVKVKTGVPQASVPGPLLFSCYMLPLEENWKKLGIQCHFYADDTVLFLCWVRPSVNSCLMIF